MIGEGEDYGSGPYSVTIPAKATSVQFDVNIHDDNVLEMDENFNLTITTPPLPGRVIITNRETTVTIVDNDGKYYSRKAIDRIINYHCKMLLHLHSIV